MNTLAATILYFALLQAAPTAPGRILALTLPHPLTENEVVWIEVKVGVIERGAEIEITTLKGQTLGVISPFGIRSGDPAGTYTVPVPPEAISDGRVKVRLTLNRYGHANRPPTTRQVKAVRLKITRKVLAQGTVRNHKCDGRSRLKAITEPAS
jgi:hypothetical protein